MPNWANVLREIQTLHATESESAFDKVRKKYLKRLSAHTDRNIIAYYSGFLSKPRLEGTEITDEDKNGIMLCIQGMDRSKGLDLILHTPGGDGKAAVSLVDYLRSMFDVNIRAIVPQIAMSAGTMVACSCKTIIMGKQSSLGPVDPQFGTISVANLLEEIRKARDDITSNPNMALFWNPILGQITPSFLQRCESAFNESNQFISTTLAKNMFANLQEPEKTQKINVVAELLANQRGMSHNTHLSYAECRDSGLDVSRLEDDQQLQDLVLTLHHCYMHSLSNTAAFKIIENHKGVRMVKQTQMQLVQAPVSLNLSGPS